jgi:hypothetical protein
MMIFDKPNSVDLLEAVNHFLDTKIKSEVPAHIVKREIEQGDELSNEIMVQLQNLIEDDSPTIDALALLIKDEKIDLEDQDLQNILVKLSKNKIAVDNPNYSTYKKLLD